MIKQINHIGISTANLDRSIGFYRDLMGLELVLDESFGNNRIDTITNLKDAEGRVALFKIGDTELEIFEFSNPSAKRTYLNPLERNVVPRIGYAEEKLDLEHDITWGEAS